MAMRSRSACIRPGCPNTTAHGDLCDKHRTRAAQARSTARGGWNVGRIRVAILYRDHGRCVLCAAPAEEVDHIVPLSRGGTNEPSNLRALCVPCHRRVTREEIHGHARDGGG